MKINLEVGISGVPVKLFLYAKILYGEKEQLLKRLKELEELE